MNQEQQTETRTEASIRERLRDYENPSYRAPTVDGIPMRPSTWRSWGADERVVWYEMRRAGEPASEAESQLAAAMGDRWPAVRKLWDEYEQRSFDQHYAEIRLLVARLKRYLPQYEDLLEWAYGIGMDYNDVFKPFYELKSDNA